MSCVLAVLASRGAALPDDRIVRRMLRGMQARGAERVEAHREGSTLLAVGRARWEMSDHLAGAVLLAREGDVVVAADASLYYRQDLVRALELAGVRARSEAAAELILAAYLAWGSRCVDHLEGDFAFVVVDGQRRKLLAARDYVGKRPIFWAEAHGVVVVASTLAAVIEHPGVSQELDLGSIARDVSALTPREDETCYTSVRQLPAGWLLECEDGGRVHSARYWNPPEIRSFARNDPHAAEEELRSLIGRATLERMAPSGSTVLCMSGGRDSSAIYGAGRSALERCPAGRSLDAVSWSFPPGDSGREDEYIESIVRHWGEEPRWVHVAPLMGRTELFFEAATRDAPTMFPFEPMNRAIAREARALGGRVILDGNGGDQVFGASTRYHADLLRTGRLWTLAREWRAEGGRGGREFFRRVVRPNLGPWTLGVATLLRRGRPLGKPADFSRQPVPWLSKSFIRDHGLRELEREMQPAVEGRDIAAHELYWHLTTPNFPMYSALLNSALLEEGVELRSPLFDERIIRFMAVQPVRERHSMGEHKWLLRRAMRGLLPENVLARRPRRTGKPDDFIVALVKALLRSPLREALERPLLAEMGIVDAPALQRAAAAILAAPRYTGYEIQLYFTLYAEQWLRSRAGVEATVDGLATPTPAAASA